MLVENLKVLELKARADEVQKWEEQFKKFETIDAYNLKEIRKIYKNVIPEITICNKELNPPKDISKYI